MEFLTEKYWGYFKNADGTHRGLHFENLIKTILDLEHGEGQWVATQKTHDGSKDFYWYNQDRCSWAECKNYGRSISLNVLSPTMVMAQICEVHEILFFSYSPINKNTKKKLIHFAEMSSKKIYFIDDEALEQVIFYYKEELFATFFPEFAKENAVLIGKKPQIHVSIFSDPMLYYNPINEAYISKIPESIEYNSLLGLYVSVSNRDVQEIPIQFAMETKNNDFYYFDILPDILKSEPITYRVEPMHTYTLKLFFRPVIYKPQVKLPAIYVSYLIDGIWHREEFEYPKINCKWIGQVRLTGETYRNIVLSFKKNILYKTHLSGICLYGTSGCGKTRLLEECIRAALNDQYQILQFSLDSLYEKESLFLGLIREIIYAIYNLPNADSLYIAEEFMSSDKTNMDSSLLIAFNLLQTLKEIKTIDEFNTWLFKYNDAIFSRLFYKKLFLVIDNVQYYDECTVSFLTQLIHYGNNNNHLTHLIVAIVFNTDYLTNDSPHMKLLNLCKKSSRFITQKVLGFENENSAKSFLRELLTFSIDLSDSLISKILLKTSLIPYNIKQTVQWMEDVKIIQYHNNHCIIVNPDKFIEKIDALPASIHLVLDERWSFWCEQNNEHEGIKIAAICFFFNGITENLIRNFQLNLSILYSMIEAHFLKEELFLNKKIWKFEHDIIQNFFSFKYKPLADKILNELVSFNWGYSHIVQESYYLMAVNKITSLETLNKILHCFYYENIPVQFKIDFYDKIFNVLLNGRQFYNNFKVWFSDCFSLIRNLRNLAGSLYALNCYEQVLHLSQCEAPDFSISIEYSWMLLEYGNISDECGQYENAIRKVEPHLNELEKNVDKSKEYQKLICYFYNRLHVYYRHSAINPLTDYNTNKYIYKALCLSNDIDDKETIYVNNSDCGYMYYFLISTKKETLNFWTKAIETFKQNKIPEKTLNYIRKCVQLNLILGNWMEALEYCKYGLLYVDTGEYAYHELFFKEWFFLAYIECCLLISPTEYKIKIQEKFTEVEECSFLLHSPKTFNYYQLKSIFYCYMKEWRYMCEATKKCTELIMESSHKTNLLKRKEMLCHNLLIMSESFAGKVPFEVLKNYLNTSILSNLGIQSNSRVPETEAQSIIRSEDHRLNFPAL